MPSDLLSSRFRTVFEETLTPLQQLQAIDSLKDYLFELEHGTDEQRRELEVIGDEDVASDVVERKLNAARERCYWQLVMFLRVSTHIIIRTFRLLEPSSIKSYLTFSPVSVGTYALLFFTDTSLPQASRPSRIAEAEPYLRVLLQSPSVVNDATNFHRIKANLHLAAALAKASMSCEQFSYRRTSKLRQSQADEALSLFSQSFASYDTPTSSTLSAPIPSGQHGLGIYIPHSPCVRRKCLPPKTELWARASYIRLLRRLSQDEEADHQLELIRCARLLMQSHGTAETSAPC